MGMPLIASQDLVSVDWTLVAQVIAFLTLLYILVRLLYNPLTQAMNERTERIRVALGAAEEAAKQAQATNAQTQVLIDQAKTQSQEILRQASASAEGVRGQIIDEARAEAQKVIERGRAEIDRERLAAFDELRVQVAEIALLAATSIVQKSLDTADNRRLIDEAIARSNVFSESGKA